MTSQKPSSGSPDSQASNTPMPSGAGPVYGQANDGQAGPTTYANIPTAPVANDRSAILWILFAVGIVSFFSLVICSGVVGALYFIGLEIQNNKQFADQSGSEGFGRSFFQRVTVSKPAKDFFSDSSFADSSANPTTEVSDVEKRAIENLIDAVMAEASDDAPALRRYVSPEGFVRQMLRSNPNLVMQQSDMQAIRNGFGQICYGPEVFAGHRIISIENVDAKDVVVTMLVWDYTDTGELMRWWIERPTSNSQGRWLLCDWKGVNYCVSEAAYYEAIYSEPSGTARLRNFYDLSDRLNSDDPDVLEQAMDDFERLDLPASLRGQLASRVANLWIYQGEPNRAKMLLSSIEQWKAKASRLDVQFGIALIQEDWPEVVRLGNRYLEVAGNDPWVKCEIAKAHVQLEDYDKAEEIWLTVADQYPLSVVVSDDIGSSSDKYSDSFLRQYIAKAKSLDQGVLELMPEGYGLRAKSEIDRCQAFDLDLEACTKKFMKARSASSILEHDRAIEILNEVVADEESASITFFDSAYYGEPTSTNLQAKAKEYLIDLEGIVLSLEQRLERSEDKTEFVSRWYWDEYMEIGETKDLQEMVQLTEAQMPDSIEFRVLKAQWLADREQWNELSQWLDSIPPLDAESEWKSELVGMRLSAAIEQGKPISELSDFMDLPYFYSTASFRLAEREDWDRLDALLQKYDSLPASKKQQLDIDYGMLRRKGQVLAGKGDFEAARHLYASVFKSDDTGSSFLAASGMLNLLRDDPQPTLKAIAELLPLDKDNDLINGVVRRALDRQDTATLESLQLEENAKKYRHALAIAISHLKGDRESLYQQIRTDLRRKESAFQYFPYTFQTEMLYAAVQDSVGKGELTFAQAIAKKMATNGNTVGTLVVAIENEAWEEVAKLVEDGVRSDFYWSPDLATWRSGEKFKEFIRRHGWQNWFSGEQLQIAYDFPLVLADDSSSLEKRLGEVEGQWRRQPDLEAELLDTKQSQRLQIWASADEPRWLLVIASLPEDNPDAAIDRGLGLEWQLEVKSALFVIATQPLDGQQKEEMLQFGFQLSKKALALVHDYEFVSREGTDSEFDERTWADNREPYYGTYLESLLESESERPRWQVMRDRFKACLDAELKVGDSVKVRLEQSNMTELIEAEVVKVGEFSDDASVRVKLKADSVLTPLLKDDLLNVEWHEISFE